MRFITNCVTQMRLWWPQPSFHTSTSGLYFSLHSAYSVMFRTTTKSLLVAQVIKRYTFFSFKKNEK